MMEKNVSDLDPLKVRADQEKQLERVRALKKKIPTEDEIREAGDVELCLKLAETLRELVDLLEDTLETNIVLASAANLYKRRIGESEA